MIDPHDEKRRSQGISRDMSPHAIAHRLEIVSQLRSLSLWLSEAKPVDGQESEKRVDKTQQGEE